ncbi:unnamed protein product, partial [Callosobruchus maculatus]
SLVSYDITAPILWLGCFCFVIIGDRFWVDSGIWKIFTVVSCGFSHHFFHIKNFLSPLKSMEPCPHATPYEALRTSPVSSEREEGEIVDDEFEDISDNSISLPLSGYGKSVSAREHLPALCLSSVTDDDDHSIFYEKTVKKRKKTYSKRKHRKRVVSKSDSDEEFVTLDKELQEQLKAAIRVDNANEEQKNNSLRTRLRGMTKNEHNLEKQANSNSEELDTELYALRSEALKTAVLNKFKYRKRKVNNLDEISSKDASQAIESKLKNETDSLQPKNKIFCIESIEEKLENVKEDEYENMKKDDNDEDEDVLRALLLASMAKRITKNTENVEIKSVEQPPPKLQPMVKPGFKTASKSEKNTIFKTHPLQLPRVKPLIINLNDDSDSDDNNLIKRSKVPLKSSPSINNMADIETAVDAFLKSQRAKVEAKEILKCEETKNKLDKSCVKLLPKNKQLEYKNLIKKLEDAKKMRLRKATLKTNLSVKMNIKNKNRVLINKHIEVNKKGPTRDTNEDLKILQKTLKEMQMNNDGKFQIQHKYASLLPTIKKITESSSERRKYDEHIKKLLQELNEIKKKSFAAHQNFSIHVKELIAKKEDIDRKISKIGNHIVTSTPLKKNIDLSNGTSTKLPTSNPNKENKINEDNGVSGQDITSAGKFEEDCTNDTEQPNSNIPQYVSPLDTVNRIIDPFSIMCPYDIDGNCCDPDCIYNHYCEK